MKEFYTGGNMLLRVYLYEVSARHHKREVIVYNRFPDGHSGKALIGAWSMVPELRCMSHQVGTWTQGPLETNV